jgi:hypothetical protein
MPTPNPTPNRTLSPRLESELRIRWKEVEPSILARLKSISVPISYGSLTLIMEAYRESHRAAVLRCLEQGIRFLRIRKWKLDDPNITEAEREQRIADFKRRQATRPGRPNKRMGRTFRDNQKAPIYPGEL